MLSSNVMWRHILYFLEHFNEYSLCHDCIAVYIHRIKVYLRNLFICSLRSSAFFLDKPAMIVFVFARVWARTRERVCFCRFTFKVSAV